MIPAPIRHRLHQALLAERQLVGTGRPQELAIATLELEDAKKAYDAHALARCPECSGFGIFLSDNGPAPAEIVCEVCEGSGTCSDYDSGMGPVWTVDEEVIDE